MPSHSLSIHPVLPVLPVVLAGGAGTRLWPLSRELYPKQFLRLVGDKTMLQHTLAMLDGLPHQPPVIVCNHDHRFIVAEQCRQQRLTPAAIVLEPVPRNTAPALALAALGVKQGEDPILLALPADGYIGDVPSFQEAVTRALPFARDGSIVTFGVEPSRPETGYGYIQAGEALADGVSRVAAFTEKPSSSVASRYLADGGYFWNSGMFAVRASVYLQELRSFRPRIYEACLAAVKAERTDLDFLRPGDAFHDCPADSIDYAVMENTSSAVVVPVRLDWTDLGSWRALAEKLESDADGNTISGDVVAVGVRNSHVVSQERLVAALGLDGVVVVETADAILVAAKDRVSEMKALIARLDADSRSELREHTTSYRPWGHAETFKHGAGFLVKRITVAPGESLSLQMHHHRAEHWVVIRGEARVQRGDDTFVINADESTYIPAGKRHRLSNRGAEPLDVIEVQVGDYLADDDIVRFDDNYGRE